MATDRIIAFFSGGPDDRGRTLEEILDWPDDDLEATHDYIQWVFPTSARSRVNLSAPLVTESTIAEFAARPELRARLSRALDRMLGFYGLRRDVDASGASSVTIDKVRFPFQAPNWLRPYNHNHLRLTRIMQSLATLGLRADAKALQRCLVADICGGPGADTVTGETRGFWLAAC
jgi:Opioid growth factor receptor (OGFr) conserved region